MGKGLRLRFVLLLGLLPSVALAEEAIDLQYQPARALGDGVCKTVYAVKGHDDRVLAVAKSLFGGALTRELDALGTLEDVGIPTPKIYVVGRTREGRLATVMARYATGSKDPKVWQYLNRKSLSDLSRISEELGKRHLAVKDLQYLVAHDGSLVVADPLSVAKKWLRPGQQIGSFARPDGKGFLCGQEAFDEIKRRTAPSPGRSGDEHRPGP
jgi:hypothetical protein